MLRLDWFWVWVRHYKARKEINPYQSTDDTAVECVTEVFSIICAGLWGWWLSSGCRALTAQARDPWFNFWSLLSILITLACVYFQLKWDVLRMTKLLWSTHTTCATTTTFHLVPCIKVSSITCMCEWLFLSTLDSRRRITRDVLVAFGLSVAALVLAIVGAIFIIPYRKCELKHRMKLKT